MLESSMMLAGWLIGIAVFLLTVTSHEAAHGAVAFLRGDRTAKERGRLTLNPLAHVDWFWTVLFPLLLFYSTHGRFVIGMAKPVPVNFSRLKNPKMDMILVGLAGPFANLILAGIFAWIFYETRIALVLLAVYFNLGLAVFNLLPIPPLDGSRVVAGFLPKPFDRAYLSLEPYGFLLVLIFYFSGLLYAWVVPGINVFARFLHVPSLSL